MLAQLNFINVTFYDKQNGEPFLYNMSLLVLTATMIRSALHTCGKVMLMRLNRLCSLREMTILPPPGGPIAASTNMFYNK